MNVSAQISLDWRVQSSPTLRMMGCLGSTLNRLRHGRSRNGTQPSETTEDSNSGRKTSDISGSFGDLDEETLKNMSLPHFLIQRDDLTSYTTDFSSLAVPENLDLTQLQLFKLIKSWRAMHRQQNITKAGVEMFVR